MPKITFIFIALISFYGLQIVGAQAIPKKDPIINTARNLALNIQKLELTTDVKTQKRLRHQIKEAIQGLKKDKDTFGTLKKVLEEKRDYVTDSSVAYALYIIDSSQVESSVEELLKQINRVGFVNINLAESLLRDMGTSAIPTLCDHLSNGKVIQLLGSMGSKAEEAVPCLIKLLGTQNVEVAAALVDIGSEKAVSAAKPVLIQVLKNPNDPKAKLAVISLGKLGSKAKESIPDVRNALQSNNSDTRLNAALALVDLGDTEFATEALGEMIEESDLHGRDRVIRKLSSLQTEAKKALPALINLLKDRNDKSYGDRTLAAIALSNIDPSNVEFLGALEKAQREPEMRLMLQKEGLLRR